MFCQQGGGPNLAQNLHAALEKSVKRHFPTNGLINCMCHSTENIFNFGDSALARVSDDFYPTNNASHTVHLANVAYISMFMGEVVVPDWDMFHSLGDAGPLHAAARAVGGCPVYVSDSPGKHDFDLLRQLVFPSGKVLRAKLPGRPTRENGAHRAGGTGILGPDPGTMEESMELPKQGIAKDELLAEMKAEPALSGMAMLRQSRLSVSPVTDAEWAVILKRAGE